MKINIAIAGGPCTGKSVLAAALFSRLKVLNFDYDYIEEQSRALKIEFGDCRSPFERFYLWRQQEREELRSTAANGFVTDCPLFYQYINAKVYATESRDSLAVRELLRMCLDMKGRYQLIVIAEDPEEIPYKRDKVRRIAKKKARLKHFQTLTFVQHFMPEKLFLVHGDVGHRVRQVIKKLEEFRNRGRTY